MCFKPIQARILAVGALLLTLGAAAWAGVEDFTLLKAVPADVALVTASRSHDGQKFITEQYQRVWEELEKVRFDRDIKVFLKNQIESEGGDLEEFEKTWTKMSEIATAVEWSKLGEREGLFAMRIGMPPEFLMLFKSAEGKSKPNFEALSGVAKSLVEMTNGQMTLETEDADGLTVHRISPQASPIPMNITLAHGKDTILIGFGAALIEQSLALLSGKTGDALPSTARFQDALKRVPKPTDEIAYVDHAKLMGQCRELAKSVMDFAPAPAPDDPSYAEHQKLLKLPGKLMDAFDMFEVTAAVKCTEGKKTTSTSVSVLRDSAKSAAFYSVMFGNEPMKDPLKFVPKAAAEFSVNSGMNLSALYTEVMKFLNENMPDTSEIKSGLDLFKDQTGFDLEKDIINTIQGGIVTFSWPGPTPYRPGNWAFLIKVTDDAKARALLDKLVAVAKENVPPDQVTISEAEIPGTTGFHQISSPMLAMVNMEKPVLGVIPGWLVVASGPPVVTAALETAEGKAENASKNERYAAEGIPAESSVTALSFSDDTKWSESVSQALQAAGMISLFAPDVAREPGMKFVLGVVPKIGKVVAKMTFFQSSSSRSTMKGSLIETIAVTNYREAPQPKKPEDAKPTSSEGAAKP